MSFDPRSLERLKQLGRELPQPIKPPETKPEPTPQRKHRVETEDDPQELFRQLMQVSPDGTVPEHLLARLKQLEKEQPIRPPAAQPSAEPGKGRKKSTENGSADEALYTAFQQLLLEEDD
jgi:hypothetical protein